MRGGAGRGRRAAVKQGVWFKGRQFTASERQPDPPAAVVVPPRATAVPSPTVKRHPEPVLPRFRCSQAAPEGETAHIGGTPTLYECCFSPCPSRCCPCSPSASRSIGSSLLMTASSWPFAPAPRRPHAPFAGAGRVASTAGISGASATCLGRAVSAGSNSRSGASGAPLPGARAVSSPSACPRWRRRGRGAPPVSPRPSAASRSAPGARPAPGWRRGLPCRSAATRCCA